MLFELMQYYCDQNVIKDNQSSINDVLLHESCTFANECWVNMDEKKRGYNKIQFPYVGAKYLTSKTKLLVMGLNLYEHGGWNSLRKDLLNVQFALYKKWKRIRLGNLVENYPGTIFWHRVAVYSSVILKQLGYHKIKDDLSNDFDGLANVIDKISFIEAVKCSPHDPNSRSAPTSTMKTNCQKAFLAKEIKVLSPDYLLILGKETLVDNDTIQKEITLTSSEGNIYFGYVSINQEKFRFFQVIHPTALGGSDREIIPEFENLVKKVFTHLQT